MGRLHLHTHTIFPCALLCLYAVYVGLYFTRIYITITITTKIMFKMGILKKPQDIPSGPNMLKANCSSRSPSCTMSLNQVTFIGVSVPPHISGMITLKSEFEEWHIATSTSKNCTCHLKLFACSSANGLRNEAQGNVRLGA